MLPGNVSCGAASAVATKLSNPDVIAYTDTGAEHEDNARFMDDCKKAFNWQVTILKSKKYNDTWDVWEKNHYLSGIAGAPCTKALKVQPRLDFQQPGDVHIFGYTADKRDVTRAEAFDENWPELNVEFPLIEQGLTKAACIDMIRQWGLSEPLTYAQGLPNANCIPCVKSQSPDYWALIRKQYPDKFNRMVTLSRDLKVRLAKLNGERIFIDEIPNNQPTTKPIVADCDFLCQIALEDA